MRDAHGCPVPFWDIASQRPNLLFLILCICTALVICFSLVPPLTIIYILFLFWHMRPEIFFPQMLSQDEYFTVLQGVVWTLVGCCFAVFFNMSRMIVYGCWGWGWGVWS